VGCGEVIVSEYYILKHKWCDAQAAAADGLWGIPVDRLGKIGEL